MSRADWNMKTFMKGASILTISAIIVKLLAAVYRIPFQNLVGDKGFFIYQQVYPFIGIFIVWTSYGFAVAVSKLLAGSTSRWRGEGDKTGGFSLFGRIIDIVFHYSYDVRSVFRAVHGRS